MTNLKPKDTKGVRLMNSVWRNFETERIAGNILFVQRKMDTETWTPFTWDDYKNHCTHNVGDSEKRVLEALVNGGKPVWNTTANLQPGYLKKTGDSYMITQKFIEVIKSA